MIVLLGSVAIVILTTTLIFCRVVVEQEPDLDEALREILENSEKRVYVILGESRRALSRKRIREWMSVLYRETVLLVVGQGTFTAHAALVFFNVIYVLLWLKTWVLPRPRDLRLLLGAEMFILCQLRDSD